MSDVTIFAPSPTLTVTVEDHPQGSEIHVHAGGQGVWQARMLRRLDTTVTICCVLSGEIGRVLRHLLEDEGISVVAVEREGRGSAYLHDRRDGRRVSRSPTRKATRSGATTSTISTAQCCTPQRSPLS